MKNQRFVQCYRLRSHEQSSWNEVICAFYDTNIFIKRGKGFSAGSKVTRLCFFIGSYKYFPMLWG